MQVRLLVDITGTRDGEDWPARGEVVDLPADEATHMLTAGLVEEVGSKVETAAVEAKSRKRAVVK